MSDPIILYTSAFATRDEFIVFLRDQNAQPVPTGSAFLGRISRLTWNGMQHVWIAYNEDPLQELDQQDIDQLKDALGSPPRTSITVEISHDEGSQRLAMEFTLAFAERWYCVVDNAHGKLYTIADAQTMLATGKHLW